MKVEVKLDATPEELRRFLGLPDLSPLNDEAVARLRAQLDAGPEGMDAAVYLAPYLAAGAGAAETLHKAFWKMVGSQTPSPPGSNRPDD